MRLRSITKHVRDQNWFAVALDFFIVVAGILIAFQITNWNEGRKNDNLERGYLIRLHEDFTHSAGEMTGAVGFLKTQTDNQGIVIDALRSCELADENAYAFQEGVRTLGYINSPPFYQRTINELMSSAGLGMIKNEDIISELAAAIQIFEFRDKVTQSVQRRVENYRYVVDEYIFINESSGARIIEFDLQEMCAEPKVVRAVAAVRSATGERIRAYQGLQQEYIEFLPIIESELESRWKYSIVPEQGAG